LKTEKIADKIADDGYFFSAKRTLSLCQLELARQNQQFAAAVVQLPSAGFTEERANYSGHALDTPLLCRLCLFNILSTR